MEKRGSCGGLVVFLALCLPLAGCGMFSNFLRGSFEVVIDVPDESVLAVRVIAGLDSDLKAVCEDDWDGPVTDVVKPDQVSKYWDFLVLTPVWDKYAWKVNAGAQTRPEEYLNVDVDDAQLAKWPATIDVNRDMLSDDAKPGRVVVLVGYADGWKSICVSADEMRASDGVDISLSESGPSRSFRK